MLLFTNVAIAPPSYDEVIASPAELPQVVPTTPVTSRDSATPRFPAVEETRFSDSRNIVTRGTLPPPINATSTLPVVSTGNYTQQ